MKVKSLTAPCTLEAGLLQFYLIISPVVTQDVFYILVSCLLVFSHGGLSFSWDEC